MNAHLCTRLWEDWCTKTLISFNTFNSKRMWILLVWQVSKFMSWGKKRVAWRSEWWKNCCSGVSWVYSWHRGAAERQQGKRKWKIASCLIYSLAGRQTWQSSFQSVCRSDSCSRHTKMYCLQSFSHFSLSSCRWGVELGSGASLCSRELHT